MSLEEWEDGAAGAALAAAAACPYCAQAGEGAGGAGGEPLDVAELCEHLEEAHPYEGPVECPFCHQEVAVDLVDHLIMDHGTGRRGSRGAGGWRQAAGADGGGSSSSAASAALRARKEAARQRFADDCMDTEDEEAEESFQKLLESLPSTSKVHLHRASAAHASSSKLKKRVDASPPRIRKVQRKEPFVEDTLTAEQKKRRQMRAHYVQSILLDTLGLD